MISGAQIRAARAMMSWTARALAREAYVPDFTLEWIEDDGTLTIKDRKALRSNLRLRWKEAGIEFIGSTEHLVQPKELEKETIALEFTAYGGDLVVSPVNPEPGRPHIRHRHQRPTSDREANGGEQGGLMSILVSIALAFAMTASSHAQTIRIF